MDYRRCFRWLPVTATGTPAARTMYRPENGDSIIRLSGMTREQWAKYAWDGYGAYLNDPEPDNPVLMRGMLRNPAAAKKAWDEFEVFERLHAKEPE